MPEKKRFFSIDPFPYEILDEVLYFPNSSEAVLTARYTDNFDSFDKAEMTFKTLAHGRCIFIRPPTNATLIYNRSVALRVRFNHAALENLNLSYVKLFLMDKVTSPQFYPDHMEM